MSPVRLFCTSLTPGEMTTAVKPSFLRERAYCTVSMLRAALETLYAGAGLGENVAAMLMDPRVDDLARVSRGPMIKRTGVLHMLMIFFRLPRRSSGSRAAVTRCTLVTLVVRVELSSFLCCVMTS